MTDDELESLTAHIDVFARVSPEHKLRIINALKKNGEVVAMTGDGINDAPALKKADIGIALGSGTDVAKEASDLILLDNNFSVIVKAIEQGRIAFDNIRKVTVFLLSGSFSEVILIFSALLMKVINPLVYLPITAIQILYINLVEDALPGISMAFEPGEGDVMKKAPFGKKEPILDKTGKIIILVIGGVIDLFLVGIFAWLFFKTNLEKKTHSNNYFCRPGNRLLNLYFCNKITTLINIQIRYL